MSNEKGYNGWSNYETWNVKLWMDNDEGSYLYWQEETQAAWEDASGDRDEAANDLATRLESWHDEMKPEVSGAFAGLLGAALSEVDWREIAESLIDDADLKADEPEDSADESASQSA